MITIVVLITVHNRIVQTLKCLEKLFNSNEIDQIYQLKCIFVDDNSSDETGSIIIEEYPEFFFFKGDGNLFWNRGMHYAFDQIDIINLDYDFIMWLNNDTYLFEESLLSLLELSKLKKNKSIIVGPCCDSKTETITTYGGWVNNKLIPLSGNVVKCETFNGNVILIPRSVAIKVGNLDYKFRHSFGDIEYGLRANRYNVDSYMLNKFVGICDLNEAVKTCFDIEKSVISRLKHLYHPLGMNPFEFFYLRNKYDGLFAGIKVFIALHLRSLFPMLWKN